MKSFGWHHTSCSAPYAHISTSKESLLSQRKVRIISFSADLLYSYSTLAIFVPGRASAFVSQLSDKLAVFAPQLTLDFIQEVAAGISKLPVSQRISCLQYMSPWVRNLSQFTDPSSRLYEHSGAKLRDCVRALIDLTVGDQEVSRIQGSDIFCLYCHSSDSFSWPKVHLARDHRVG